jgi:hypothetical protein
VRWRRRGVFELVEQAQLLLEQERAVERLVGVLDLVQPRELLDALFGRRPSAATSGCS